MTPKKHLNNVMCPLCAVPVEASYTVTSADDWSAIARVKCPKCGGAASEPVSGGVQFEQIGQVQTDAMIRYYHAALTAARKIGT
jgi:endogenous inhibitor of DNA gyrase (YacG/DUF329 family)